MPHTLYLHIGMHKTGSTALQRTLHKNAEYIKKYGLEYPTFAINHSAPMCSLFHPEPHRFQLNIIQGIDTPEKAKRFNDKTRAQLTTVMQRADSGEVVISGEGMGRLPIDRVAALKDFVEPHFENIKVVAYLRKPIAYISSAAQEILKRGTTLEQLHSSPPFPGYRTFLEKYFDIFGRENVDVRLYRRDRDKSWDIVQDFLSLTQCRINRQNLKSPVMGVNESLSFPAARIISALNEKYPRIVNGVRNPARAKYAHVLIRQIKGEKFVLPVSVLLKNEARIREDCAWIKSTTGIDLPFDAPSHVTAMPEEGFISDKFIANIANQFALFFQRGEGLTRYVLRARG